MQHAACALGRSQSKIVVLRSFEPFAETAQGVEQPASHDERVAHVHICQQKLRRPVRLELRIVVPPVRVDLVVIGIHKVSVAAVCESNRNLRETVGVHSSSWSRNNRKSPVARDAAVLVAALMLPFRVR